MMRSSTKALRWIAYSVMIFGHIVLVFWPEQIMIRAISKVAFPMFAGMVAHGLLVSRDTRAYLTRILVLAVVSQPLYTWALGIPMWNDVFYLFGLALVLAWLQGKKDAWPGQVEGAKIRKYWHYAIYPGHLLVLGITRGIIQ